MLFQKITNRPKCNLFDRKDFPKILAYIIRSLEISFTAIELSNIASKFGRYSQDFIDYYSAPISLLKTNKKFENRMVGHLTNLVADKAWYGEYRQKHTIEKESVKFYSRLYVESDEPIQQRKHTSIGYLFS